MSTLQEVSDADFSQTVLDSDVPVLVDFWAPWCGPCKLVAPIIEQIAEENQQALVVKVNVDESPQAAAAAGVTGIPTLNVYRDGQVVAQVIGAQPKPVLNARLVPFLQ